MFLRATGVRDFLPGVDVRAAYSMYFRWFLFFAVPAGLLAKLVYLRLCAQMSWQKRAIADVVMTAISSTLTIFTVPLAWLVLALPRVVLNRIGSANSPVTGRVNPS